MNAIGELGRLIIAYQSQIEIVLLCILALIVLVAIIRAFIRAERTKNVLEDIDEKVTNIGKTIVNMQLNAKDTEGSAAKGEPRSCKSNESCMSIVKEDSVDKCADGNLGARKDEEVKIAAHDYKEENISSDDHRREFHWGIESLDEISSEKKGQEETAWEKAVIMRKAEKAANNLFFEDEDSLDVVSELPKKYFSRNDNIDKKGNVYTEEMLKEQIR